jgi:hypothetical protein
LIKIIPRKTGFDKQKCAPYNTEESNLAWRRIFVANFAKTKQHRTFKQSGLLFALVCFLVLCAVMLSGAANFLNSEEAYFYDDFSNNLMKGISGLYASLACRGHFPGMWGRV